MARTVVLIPTYNERELVRPIVEAVRAAAPQATVMVVDDASPDGTGVLADELAAADPNVRVLHRPGKEGLGRAYLDAFRLALGEGWDHIVQMDADFSHDPQDVPRLLTALEGGAELAIGSRYVAGGGTRNWGAARRLISRGGSAYARAILGVPIHDLTTGFKAWTAGCLRATDLDTVDARGYGFQIAMTYRALRAGRRVVEVPIWFEDRRVGQSKMSGTIFFEAVTLVWRLRLGGR